MQPYKPQLSIYNAVDSVLVLLMVLWSATFMCISIAGLKAHSWLVFLVVLLFIASLLPLFYHTLRYFTLNLLSKQIPPESERKDLWLD